MIIEITNLRCRLVAASPEESKWLDDILSFERKKKFGRVEYGDGRSHLFSRVSKTFPAGFGATVRKYAQRDGVKLELLDRRTRPAEADPDADLAWLRPYQLEAVERARTRERGVFWHVTGAGKTEVAAALIKTYPTVRWLFVVHRKDLMVQTAERFERRGLEGVGMIGDGVWNPGARVTVAMFPTLHRTIKAQRTRELLASATGLMVDECHILPAGAHYAVAMAISNAYYRYGFSGTPFARGDEKSLYLWGALGPVIHRVSAEQLIKADVIAQPTIHMLPVVQRITGTNWHELYREGVVDSKVRNAAVVAAARRAEKPCLVFVKSIDHGKSLRAMLEDAGEQVEFVWGTSRLEVRQAAIRRLVHGDTDILIANVIFQEGIDIPELQSLVIASGGQSTIMVLQDVGRGMRKYTANGSVAKSAFQVFDIADRGNRVLARHTQARLKAYGVEKYPVVEERGLVY